MGGASCAGFSLTELWLKILAKKYECSGVKSEFVVLDNGTKMHCWTPTPPMAENGVWSVPSPKPPLVLLQGFAPNAMLFWRKQVPQLMKDFNVYVPDLVFLGKSVTTYKARLTESFQAECIVKMLQFLGVQEEVDVVGAGYGGFVAFRMAQMYPKYVNKVVFSSTGICMAPGNNDALLQRHGFDHTLQLLIPESAVDFKIAIASASYWKPWLPKSFYEDMIEVGFLFPKLLHINCASS